MLDIGGPGMMLAYSVGRIGCHMSGDGDWGIININPKPFSWLPDWLWAYTYPNNVAIEGDLFLAVWVNFVMSCLCRYTQHRFMKWSFVLYYF